MKKLFPLCLLASFAVAFTGCSDDDDPTVKNPDIPTVSTGAFVLNQGLYGKLDGSLNVIDYTRLTYATNVFKNANGRSIGATPQCGIVYGSKIYVGMSESKTIEIIDRHTYKSVKQIRLENNPEGSEPRSMVAKGGKVYVSLYEGYVARLDTLKAEIDATVKVGPNPEIIAIHGNYIYVPNSDGLNWATGAYGETASVLSIEPFREVRQIKVPMNPKQFLTNGKNLYLLCMGNYKDKLSAIYSIASDDSYTEVAKASMAAIKDNTLYLVNDQFADPENKGFFNYDISSSKLTPVTYEGVEAASGMGVDPITGNIVITSNFIEGGTTQYDRPGMTLLYDAGGKLITKFDGKTGQACIFFNEE